MDKYGYNPINSHFKSDSLDTNISPSSVLQRLTLLNATIELREKHRKLLDAGKKRKSLVSDRMLGDSTKFLYDIKEIPIDNPDPPIFSDDDINKLDVNKSNSPTSTSPTVKLRHYHGNLVKLRRNVTSCPTFPRSDSFTSSISIENEKSEGLDQRLFTTNSDNSRHSSSSMDSSISEMRWSAFVNKTVQERIKDETTIVSENQHLPRMTEMSQTCSQDSKSSEKREQDDQKLAADPLSENPPSSSDTRNTEILRRLQQSKDTNAELLMRDIDHVIGELECQLSECMKELEMDKALLDVKLTAERRCLMEEEKKCEELKDKIIQIEEDYIRKREKCQTKFDEDNKKLESSKKKMDDIQKQIDGCPESLKESMKNDLESTQDLLEQELRELEDAEFNMLECITNLDEEKEENQEKLIIEKKILETKIQNRKNRLKFLEVKLAELEAKQKFENQRLNKERDSAIELLQQVSKEKNGLRRAVSLYSSSNDETYFRTRQTSRMHSPPKQKVFLLDDFIDSISFSEKSERNNPDFSPKPDEITKTNCLLPTISPNQSISRQSLRITDESPQQTSLDVITQQNQQMQPYNDFRSRPEITTPSCGRGIPLTETFMSSDGKQSIENVFQNRDRRSIYSIDSVDLLPENADLDRILKMGKLLAEAQVKKERLLYSLNLPQNQQSNFIKQPSIKQTNDNESKHIPKCDDTSSVTLRNNNKKRRQARPSSRYLPVRSSDFDLRQHIDACGHNVTLCQHLLLTASTCRGYMSKKSGKLKIWKKRWFVFDRNEKNLIYYADKRENKERGKIPFEAIEDVFLDHLKTQRGQNSSLTFCVKCYDRIHYFSAPTSETMRIWIDVIVTGAEGYREYMKTLERKMIEQQQTDDSNETSA